MNNDEKASPASRALKLNLNAEDRPREKAKAKGFTSLTTAELLATLIGSGTRGESVVELCQRILHDNDGKLYNIARLTVNDLCRKYRGIGEVKAIEILAALELARRYQAEKFDELPLVTTSDDAYRVMRPLLSHLQHEEVWVLLLNRAKRVIARVRVGQGGTSATVVDVKIILRHALERLAEAVILAHNHPSGNLRPSDADDALTHSVKKGCKAVGIELLDHIIVSQNGYFSYNQSSKL